MPDKTNIPVIIADECNATRMGLREMVRKDYTVLDTAHSHELTEYLVKNPGGVILLDENLPGLNIPAFTQLVKDKFPDARIILRINHFKPVHIHNINEKHYAGHVLKNACRKELNECVEAAMQKRIYISKELGAFMLRDNANDEQPETLFTSKELEVYYHLIQGKEVKEIADLLHRSADTIYAYQKTIFLKTKTSNGGQLIIYAFTKGWINGDDLKKWGKDIMERKLCEPVEKRKK